MVPLRDDNPTKITAYVTYSLMVLNIVIFWHEVKLSAQELEQFFQLYAVVPQELTASFQGISTDQRVPEWLTPITSQFLHGGIVHLAGNMLFLWIFGNNIEEKLGRFKYLFFYLTCGALAALTQWFFTPQSPIPSLGASGAIAGVMGAYIIRFPQAKIITLIPLGFFITLVRIPAVFFLGFWFLQQAFSGIASLEVSSSLGGVAYWAHAGGFIAGIILAPFLGLFADRNRS